MNKKTILKATELRIGNLIMWDDESHEIITVKSIIHSHDEEYTVKFKGGEAMLDEFVPITLAEEWLVKFGFVKFTDWQFDFWKNSMWNLEEYKNKKYYTLYHCSDEVDCTMIKYVHQLQNLYFALTGEELTIKNNNL